MEDHLHHVLLILRHDLHAVNHHPPKFSIMGCGAFSGESCSLHCWGLLAFGTLDHDCTTAAISAGVSRQQFQLIDLTWRWALTWKDFFVELWVITGQLSWRGEDK